MKKNVPNFVVVICTQILAASPLFAHPGHGLPSLLHGILHPLQGVDHLVAALVVGILAARGGNSARVGFPLAFASGVLWGGFCGFQHISLPFLEGGILLSIGVLLCMFLLPKRIAPQWLVLGIAVLGGYHGNAHALECGVDTNAMLYAGGFILSTLLLQGLGILVGWQIYGEKLTKAPSVN